MKQIIALFLAATTLVFYSCKTNNGTNQIVITITNDLNIERRCETVEISKQAINIIDDSIFKTYGVVDTKTGNAVQLYQHFDKDGDGTADVILFQPVVKPNSSVKYILKVLKQPQVFESKVFSRFVPERTDDYAWENDKVAFRVFGPKAQIMVEQNIKGGTLTSGIDCWLKKVDYPIIDKWYEKHTNESGSYHKDSGEGFDNFHVGSSRGCGGIGVWEKDSLWASENFISWKRIANGPIRTTFILDYANWKVGEKIISEKQTISLDLGSNLSKIEVDISGTLTIAAGITLHNNTGETRYNPDLGWLSYWEPFPKDNYNLGMAIVVDTTYLNGFRKFVSPIKDYSHFFVDLQCKNDKLIYYSGFSWTKSEQFPDKKAWEKYLDEFALKLQNPLTIDLNNQRIKK